MTREPRVTVVIPVRNAAEDLLQCLEALDAQTFRGFDVLVVDGHSVDGTAEVAAKHGARVVTDDGNTRAHACGTALRHVSAEFVAFTDADCLPDPDWLEVLYGRLSRAPALYAAIGGPNVSPDSDTWLGKTVDVVFATRLMSGGTRYGFTSAADVEINHNPGCNVLYRTAAVRDVGFEEFPTAEDVVLDHCLRVAGRRLLYTPHAVVRHKRRGTLPGFARQVRRYAEGRALAARRYPLLWQPVYPLPTAGLAVAVTLLAFGVWELLSLGSARALTVLGALLLAYVGLVTVDVSLSRSPHLTATRGAAAVALALIGQIAWGVGYVRGPLLAHSALVTRSEGLARDVTFILAVALASFAAFFMLM